MTSTSQQPRRAHFYFYCRPLILTQVPTRQPPLFHSYATSESFPTRRPCCGNGNLSFPTTAVSICIRIPHKKETRFSRKKRTKAIPTTLKKDESRGTVRMRQVSCRRVGAWPGQGSPETRRSAQQRYILSFLPLVSGDAARQKRMEWLFGCGPRRSRVGTEICTPFSPRRLRCHLPSFFSLPRVVFP